MTDPRQPPFPPPPGPSGTPPIQQPAVAPSPRPRVRETLVRVIAVQVATLLLLWALQAHFTR